MNASTRKLLQLGLAAVMLAAFGLFRLRYPDFPYRLCDPDNINGGYCSKWPGVVHTEAFFRESEFWIPAFFTGWFICMGAIFWLARKRN